MMATMNIWKICKKKTVEIKSLCISFRGKVNTGIIKIYKYLIYTVSVIIRYMYFGEMFMFLPAHSSLPEGLETCAFGVVHAI